MITWSARMRGINCGRSMAGNKKPRARNWDGTHQLEAVKKHLSEAEVLTFFRTAMTDPWPSHSLEMTCRDLDLEVSLSDLFARFNDRVRDRGDLFINFEVEPLGHRYFVVTFGHQGPGYGDGRIWVVQFDEQGQVVHYRVEGFWMC